MSEFILDEDMNEENADWYSDAEYTDSEWADSPLGSSENPAYEGLIGAADDVKVVAATLDDMGLTMNVRLLVDAVPRTRAYPFDFLPETDEEIKAAIDTLVIREFNPVVYTWVCSPVWVEDGSTDPYTPPENSVEVRVLEVDDLGGGMLLVRYMAGDHEVSDVVTLSDITLPVVEKQSEVEDAIGTVYTVSGTTWSEKALVGLCDRTEIATAILIVKCDVDTQDEIDHVYVDAFVDGIFTSLSFQYDPGTLTTNDLVISRVESSLTTASPNAVVDWADGAKVDWFKEGPFDTFYTVYSADFTAAGGVSTTQALTPELSIPSGAVVTPVGSSLLVTDGSQTGNLILVLSQTGTSLTAGVYNAWSTARNIRVVVDAKVSAS